MIDTTYEKAKEVLEKSSTKNGMYASAGIDGYDAVWSRDSMISCIGASLDSKFKIVFKKSLITLGKHQSKTGQIPNAVDKWSKRKPHVDFASIDSSLWYIIGHFIYAKRFKDQSLLKTYKKSIEKALFWLECQDVGEDGTLEQLPTTDWQDAFPHKYGRTINTQALYYKVLKLTKDETQARRLRKVLDKDDDKGLWNGNFYYAYRWKNHGKYREIGEWFDSLGNLMAIVFGLADEKKAKKILNYITKKKISEPYPVRAIYPPIRKGTKDWQDYYDDCDAREPHHYLNGGIWTFIGGFYILALVKLKQFKKAEKELEKLAKANLDNNFPEWIDPNNKESYGDLQTWNAGMYILAYESVKKKRVLL